MMFITWVPSINSGAGLVAHCAAAHLFCPEVAPACCMITVVAIWVYLMAGVSDRHFQTAGRQMQAMARKVPPAALTATDAALVGIDMTADFLLRATDMGLNPGRSVHRPRDTLPGRDVYDLITITYC